MYQSKIETRRVAGGHRESFVSCQIGAVTPKTIGLAYFAGTAANDNRGATYRVTSAVRVAIAMALAVAFFLLHVL